MCLRPNLRQMRYAEYLMVPAKITETFSHYLSHRSSDAGIHFIKNKHGNLITLCQNRFQSQHHAGQFPSLCAILQTRFVDIVIRWKPTRHG